MNQKREFSKVELREQEAKLTISLNSLRDELRKVQIELQRAHTAALKERI